MLTDRCKKDFEEWYKVNNYPTTFHAILHFDKLNIAMQWGVYQDFFDSVGIYISMEVDEHMDELEFHVLIIDYISQWSEDLPISETRQDARERAVKRANELYNIQIIRDK